MSGSAEDELAELARTAAGELTGFLSRRLAGTGIDPQDVAQDALANALSALRPGKRPTDMRAWLFTIARNCAHEARTRESRTTRVDLSPELLANADDPARTTAARALVDQTFAAIDQLPQNQRAALIARELEGQSHERIAAMLGLSPTAVKALVFRARRAVTQRVVPALLGPIDWLRRGVLAPKTAAKVILICAAAACGPSAVDALPQLSLPVRPVPDTPTAAVLMLPPIERAPHRHADPTPRARQRGLGTAQQAAAAARACSQGRPLTALHPRTAREAIRRLPDDVREYSDCEAQLNLAAIVR